MQQSNKQLILRKDDYELLLSYLRGNRSQAAFNRQEAEELQAELQRAAVVEKDAFPPDIVRINSKVKIRENGKVMELTLVTPEKANIKERKISVMAPIGAALIGFRKGQQVQWRVPAGMKTFDIVEVENQQEEAVHTHTPNL
jgi:regulator of nucleoside diphosphate kinase